MRRFIALAALMLAGACSQTVPRSGPTESEGQTFIEQGAYEGGGRYYVAPMAFPEE